MSGVPKIILRLDDSLELTGVRKAVTLAVQFLPAKGYRLRLDAVAHACNPSYLGGWGKRTTWTRQVGVAVSQDCATALQPGQEWDFDTLSRKQKQKTRKAAIWKSPIMNKRSHVPQNQRITREICDTLKMCWFHTDPVQVVFVGLRFLMLN